METNFIDTINNSFYSIKDYNKFFSSKKTKKSFRSTIKDNALNKYIKFVHKIDGHDYEQYMHIEDVEITEHVGIVLVGKTFVIVKGGCNFIYDIYFSEFGNYISTFKYAETTKPSLIEEISEESYKAAFNWAKEEVKKLNW